jgi:hypothetical protein
VRRSRFTRFESKRGSHPLKRRFTNDNSQLVERASRRTKTDEKTVYSSSDGTFQNRPRHAVNFRIAAEPEAKAELESKIAKAQKEEALFK